MDVFLVQHLRDDEDETDAKICGVFSSSQNAEIAIAALSKKPGFREYRNGFYMDKYNLDEVCWLEGFVGNENVDGANEDPLRPHKPGDFCE